MFQRYAFLAVFAALLTGLGAWSTRVELERTSNPAASAHAAAGISGSETDASRRPGPFAEESVERRLDLIETLEKVVSYEHTYYGIYGHFTKLMSRTGVEIPASLASNYEVRISEAAADHLLVSAFSERNGTVDDWATIDENFNVHSNFNLPQPRSSSLRFQAQRHLQELLAAPDGFARNEAGVYKGFFKYEVRRDSESRKVAFAVGIKSPVRGVELEVREGQQLLSLSGLDPEKLTELSRLSALPADLPVEPIRTRQKFGRQIAGETRSAGQRLEIEPIDSVE